MDPTYPSYPMYPSSDSVCNSRSLFPPFEDRDRVARTLRVLTLEGRAGAVRVERALTIAIRHGLTRGCRRQSGGLKAANVPLVIREAEIEMADLVLRRGGDGA